MVNRNIPPAHTTHSTRRFIPSEDLHSHDVRLWQFGAIGSGGSVGEAVVLPSGHGQQLEPLQHRVIRTLPEGAFDPEQDEESQDQEEGQAQLNEEQWHQLLEQARQDAFRQGIEQGFQSGLEQGIERGKEEGLADGLEQGKREGSQETEQAWNQRMQEYQDSIGEPAAQSLAQLVQQAQKGIEGLQQQVAPDLLQLACDIARQVVRQELRCNPQALLPVVREALDMLGTETRPAIVRVHPQDWAQLKDHLRAALPNPKLEWLQDAGVGRGGCAVESQGAQIDGTLEKRWQRAVAALGLVSTWYGEPQEGHGNGGNGGNG